MRMDVTVAADSRRLRRCPKGPTSRSRPIPLPPAPGSDRRQIVECIEVRVGLRRYLAIEANCDPLDLRERSVGAVDAVVDPLRFGVASPRRRYAPRGHFVMRVAEPRPDHARQPRCLAHRVRFYDKPGRCVSVERRPALRGGRACDSDTHRSSRDPAGRCMTSAAQWIHRWARDRRAYPG